MKHNCLNNEAWFRTQIYLHKKTCRLNLVPGAPYSVVVGTASRFTQGGIMKIKGISLHIREYHSDKDKTTKKSNIMYLNICQIKAQNQFDL